MVTLPPDFIAIKHPGYFWNTTDNQLYSVKVTGMLKPMKLVRRWNSRFGGYVQGTPDETTGYSLSKKGRHYFISLETLKALTPKDTVFPIYTQLELPL